MKKIEKRSFSKFTIRLRVQDARIRVIRFKNTGLGVQDTRKQDQGSVFKDTRIKVSVFKDTRIRVSVFKDILFLVPDPILQFTHHSSSPMLKENRPVQDQIQLQLQALLLLQLLLLIQELLPMKLLLLPKKQVFHLQRKLLLL
jgi:hypothetical protein